MSIRTSLTAAALLCLAATPGFAQSSNDQTIGAGRSMGSPEGNVLTRPADPNASPQGAQQPATGKATGKEGDTAATNVKPTPGSGGQPSASQSAQSSQQPAAERPAALNTSEATGATGARGGGALAAGQVYAEDLPEMSVNLKDKEDFGKVAGTVIDTKTGQVQTLLISTGGPMGMGDTIYDVPWNRIASIDPKAKEIRVNVSQSELHPQAKGERTQSGQ